MNSSFFVPVLALALTTGGCAVWQRNFVLPTSEIARIAAEEETPIWQSDVTRTGGSNMWILKILSAPRDISAYCTAHMDEHYIVRDTGETADCTHHTYTRNVRSSRKHLSLKPCGVSSFADFHEIEDGLEDDEILSTIAVVLDLFRQARSGSITLPVGEPDASTLSELRSADGDDIRNIWRWLFPNGREGYIVTLRPQPNERTSLDIDLIYFHGRLEKIEFRITETVIIS